MFDQRNDVPIVFFEPLTCDQKGIECIIMNCGVNLGIQNAEIFPVEIAAYPCEQVGAIEHIDCDLQSFTYRRQTTLDHRFR